MQEENAVAEQEESAVAEVGNVERGGSAGVVEETGGQRRGRIFIRCETFWFCLVSLCIVSFIITIITTKRLKETYAAVYNPKNVLRRYFASANQWRRANQSGNAEIRIYRVTSCQRVNHPFQDLIEQIQLHKTPANANP